MRNSRFDELDAGRDYAPAEPQIRARLERMATVVIGAVIAAMVLMALYAAALHALAVSEAAEASLTEEWTESLCDTDMDCFLRFCAEDLSCDGGPEVF